MVGAGPKLPAGMENPSLGWGFFYSIVNDCFGLEPKPMRVEQGLGIA